MRPDSAVRLVFGAASTVRRVARTQPETVGAAFRHVTAAIEAASRRAGHSHPPRLIAVTKGRSVDLVQEAYSHGARHFGENYVKELLSKARYLRDVMGGKMEDIRWHFIGRIQRNAKKLVEVPGLWMMETVDSCRCAKALDQRWIDRKEGQGDREDTPLRIMLQINTSGEESKQGCAPDACGDLAQYVIEECPHLKLTGLMTIGQRGQTITPNPDFVKLLYCRERLCQQLVKCTDLELSMGMTEDYEHAIKLGSTNVRIGRAIFSEHT